MLYNIRRSKEKKHIISDINVTPLVDLMLVLLVIFMVTTPIITSQVEIDLPEGSKNNINKIEHSPITLKVNEKKELYLENYKTSFNDLIDKLLSISNNHRKINILFHADKNLSYGFIMNIISKMHSNGFNNVSLIYNVN